jgi:hypothetical protein
MPQQASVGPVESSARRLIRKKLAAWTFRQLVVVGLAVWLFPKYPWMWWLLMIIVPAALLSLYQLVKFARTARRVDGTIEKVEDALRRLDQA